MSEKYISASLFKEAVIPSINKTFQNEETMRLTLVGIIEKSLDVFPAADVEPVVRGEWDKTKDKEHDFRTYFCSVCGKGEYYFNATQYAYCPHCGAHMMERSGSGEKL